MASTPTPNHVLYIQSYSICSLMVRYTLAIRGQAKNEAAEIIVEEREIDTFHEAQLDEHFLCEINPKGQVIALPYI